MSEINKGRFEILLNHVHQHPNGRYCLFDNAGHYVEAVYDTDYESDNGMDEDEAGYEGFQCILFRRTSDGSLLDAEISPFGCCNALKSTDIIRRGGARVITADNILITRALIARIIWIPQIIRITGIYFPNKTV